MTPDDMRFLLNACPEGWFSPTWYQPAKTIRLPDEFEEHLEQQNARYKMRGYACSMNDAGFYFNFPRDAAGEALLAKLFLPEEIEPNQWRNR